MKLFFDTETTGKADFKASFANEHQPHIVQLPALLTEDDGTERGSMDVIVTPAGWTIPDEAAAIHGITTEIATRCGIPLLSAMSTFSMFCANADTIIAHNIDFDLTVALTAYCRLAKEHRFGGKKQVCTMKATTPLCRLPGNYGKFKWPKLSEAYLILLKKEMQNAHNALADVRACAEIFFHIQPKPEPAAQQPA